MTGEARRIKAELVVDGRWELGEGPIWDTQEPGSWSGSTSPAAGPALAAG